VNGGEQLHSNIFTGNEHEIHQYKTNRFSGSHFFDALFQVEGRVDEATGKVKEATGVILDDKGMQIEGNIQKNIGKVQKGYGDLKQDIQEDKK
jgi:uncharacterized protein YjbJ (UPF0337 family)